MSKPKKEVSKKVSPGAGNPNFLEAAKRTQIKPGETRNPWGRPKKGLAITDQLLATGNELINGHTLKLVLAENDPFFPFIKRYVSNKGAQPLKLLAMLRVWLEAANGNMVAVQIAYSRLEGKIRDAAPLPPDEEPKDQQPAEQVDPYKQVVELVRVLIANGVFPADTFARLASPIDSNGNGNGNGEVITQ